MFEPDAQEGSQPPERAELVLMVDKIFMASIVGKGGENIRGIREASAVTVMIPNKGMGSPLEGPEEETVVVRLAAPCNALVACQIRMSLLPDQQCLHQPSLNAECSGSYCYAYDDFLPCP